MLSTIPGYAHLPPYPGVDASDTCTPRYQYEKALLVHNVAYPICRSVCRSVRLSAGKCTVAKRLIDPDAVWDGEWGRSKDGCVRRGW